MSVARLTLVLHLASWWMGTMAVTCTVEANSCLFPPCSESVPGCLLPDSPYGYIGSNITLNCTLVNSTRASELYFTWRNDDKISSEYQQVIFPDNDTLQLNMPVTDDTFNEVIIHCKAAWNTISFSQQLEVDYPPSNMTMVKIVVADWRNLTVRWERIPNYVNLNNINVSVLWTAYAAHGWYHCDEDNKTFCFLGVSFRDSSDYTFNITVTNTRTEERHNQSFSFVKEQYVKPAPLSLKLVNNTSTCIKVKWTHHRKRNMTFKVIVKWRNQEVFNNSTDDFEAEICDLRPFQMYEMCALARPYVTGYQYWSDPACLNVTTLPDIPDSGPLVTPGGFHAEDCHSNIRKVIVFLKLPDEDERNGEITHYSLKYVPSDGSRDILSEPDKDLPYDSAKLSCNIDYDVSMTVNNCVGPSPPSKLHIPRRGSIVEPENIRVSQNNTSFNEKLANILWEAGSQAQPLSWTVIWCRGILAFKSCQREISWMEVTDGSQRSASLDNIFNPSFIYGVSMTTQTGSSGVRWTDCLYDVEKGPTQKPKIQSVDSWPKLALTVKWLLPVCEDSTLITNYIIEYCPIGGTWCVKKRITSDHSQHVIHGLQKDVSYSVTLAQVSVSGKQGQISDPVIGVAINNDLTAGQIVGIVFGCAIFLVIILAAIVQCFRFVCRKWKEKEDIFMPRNPQIEGYTIYQDSNPSLPDRQEISLNSQPMPIANGCVRQNSIDSGMGSMKSGTNDNRVQSQDPMPTGQFQPVFTPLEEEGSLSGSTSKKSTSLHIPQGYALFTVDNSAQSTEDDPTEDEGWGNSGGFSNGGYDSESESLDPYVTAVKEMEKGEDATGSNSASTAGSMMIVDKDQVGLNEDIDTEDKNKEIDSDLVCKHVGHPHQLDIICQTALSSDSPSGIEVDHDQVSLSSGKLSEIREADSAETDTLDKETLKADCNKRMWEGKDIGDLPLDSQETGRVSTRDIGDLPLDSQETGRVSTTDIGDLPLDSQETGRVSKRDIGDLPLDSQETGRVSPEDEGIESLESNSDNSDKSDIHSHLEIDPMSHHKQNVKENQHIHIKL